MTDLDFDELDKAVNSLMDQKDQATEANTVSTSSESVAPDDTTNTIPDVPAQGPTAAATSAVARRRGTFMDVVHPSSNMRARPSTAAIPTVISREGVKLTPPIPAATQEVQSPVVVPREVSDTDLTKQLTEAKETEQDTVTYDPIAFAEQTERGLMTSSNNLLDENPVPNEAEDTLRPPETMKVIQPLESPFLPDAKVEKRPLGGTQNDMGVKPSDSFADEPIVSPNGLPDELSKQILELESETSPAVAQDEAQEAPIVETQASNHEETALVESQQHDEDKKLVDIPASSGAIPQQYTEKTASNTDDNHATIYDPEYHQQGMKHQEKKRSGWGVVAIIVVLVALGGAGGVAYYYLTTGGF